MPTTMHRSSGQGARCLLRVAGCGLIAFIGVTQMSLGQEPTSGPLPPPGMLKLPPVVAVQAEGAQTEKPKQAEPGDQPAPLIRDKADVGPQPNVFEGFPAKATRLPRLTSPFTSPQPTKKDIEDNKRFVSEVIDPKFTLDLVQGRGRLLMLKEVSKRVQVVDEKIVLFNVLNPKEITVIGRRVGTTNLNLWFADPQAPGKERVVSYLVRVFPDPDAKERLERAYKALEDEINQAFPDSIVHIKMVGEKVVLSGQAHDIAEATQILRIVRANVPNDDVARIPTDEVHATVDGIPGLDQFRITTVQQLRAAGGSNIINLMRIPGEQQVMLRVTVAEVNRSAARSIGLNFSYTNNQGVQVVANNTGNILGGNSRIFENFTNVTALSNTLGALATANIPVALDNGQLKLAINALRNLNYARSLAEPNLVALNGQTASFHAGGEFPVPYVTGYTASGLQGVNFIPYGVNLQFTPFITDKDRVRLQVSAIVSTRELGTGANISGTIVPGLNTRNFQTTVELREGQTLAVAGLIQNNLGADATRVPGIGDLPVLSWLTGLQRTSAAEQELVVLITPELVHPLEAGEVPPLPGSDLFEPSDCEFFLCGRLESRRDYDYRSPAMTDLARMRRYHRCEQLYIIGPHGHSAGVLDTVREK